MAGSFPRSRARRTAGAPSVDPSEVAKFAALAEAWWDEAGDFAP